MLSPTPVVPASAPQLMEGGKSFEEAHAHALKHAGK